MTSSPQTSLEVSALGEYLDGALLRIEDALSRYLPEAEAGPGVGCPARLAHGDAVCGLGWRQTAASGLVLDGG